MHSIKSVLKDESFQRFNFCQVRWFLCHRVSLARWHWYSWKGENRRLNLSRRKRRSKRRSSANILGGVIILEERGRFKQQGIWPGPWRWIEEDSQKWGLITQNRRPSFGLLSLKKVAWFWGRSVLKNLTAYMIYRQPLEGEKMSSNMVPIIIVPVMFYFF